MLEKTAGNPFFVIQFLSALVDEGMLAFEHASARWQWDVARIRAKGYTDNVVELMVGKLSRMAVPTHHALRELACLGTSAAFGVLAMVREGSEQSLRRDLEEALQSGLVLSGEDSYRFLHDRVQEAPNARF